jgi:hypothetical protein
MLRPQQRLQQQPRVEPRSAAEYEPAAEPQHKGEI